MNTTKNYITSNGIKSLQEELKTLFKVERPKVVETVAWAAGNGDRSENGDYIYGKKRLREIDKRIRFLTKRIEAAEVINPKELKTDKVVFGATVTIEDEEGLIKTYQIVGEDEIDTKNNKISWKSPLARALLGKAKNSEAQVKRPKGISFVTIVKIEFL